MKNKVEKFEINWTGNLKDDCTAEWEGMTLRAEEMDKADWWWAVYDSDNELIFSSNDFSEKEFKSGKAARHAAEQAAYRKFQLES